MGEHAVRARIIRNTAHDATVISPYRANGAAIVATYSGREPDEAFADVLEEIHEQLNTPVDVEDPWLDNERDSV